jgi:hypothetical protein
MRLAGVLDRFRLTFKYYHFMDSYMVEIDTDALEKMKAILGNKKSARPIVIKDLVNIILQKF